MVGQIGTAKSATKFLETIRNNAKISKVVYCGVQLQTPYITYTESY